MQLIRTFIAAAVAVAITAAIAIGISRAQEPPPIPVPPPFNLEVSVTKVTDDLCVLTHNADAWGSAIRRDNGSGLGVNQTGWVSWEVRAHSGRRIIGYMPKTFVDDHARRKDNYHYTRYDVHPRIKNQRLTTLINGINNANEHEHHIRLHGVKKLSGDRRESFTYVYPYNWTTDATLFDIEQDLHLCIERLHQAFDNNKHKRETYERLTAKQNELTLTKEQLDYVRESGGARNRSDHSTNRA